MAKKTKRKSAKKKSAGEKLNPLQRKFCKLYASDREFFGNGVQAYAKAYNIDITTKVKYNTARTNASRLLTNANILAYIDKLLDLSLNKAHVDKQLAFLITQNANYSVKMAAIREFNALRKRVIEKKERPVTFALALHEYHQARKDKN